MPKTLKVLGEYAILKVKDPAGSPIMLGYYRDAVVPNVDDENAQHHIDSGLAEEHSDGFSEESDDSEEPAVEAPEFERPHGNAGRDAWANYVLESGQASEDEIKDLSRDELREKYV